MKSLSKLALTPIPWRVYNAGLVVLAVVVFGTSLAFYPDPVDPQWVNLPTGARFGETCGFLAVTGLPCPQCGMTRSFVYAARLDLVASFFYSPGGLALFLWAQVAGVIGAVRLVRGDPFALTLPWQITVGWALAWTFLLYLGPYALRLAGINPLP
jgi:hypothetical protein